MEINPRLTGRYLTRMGGLHRDIGQVHGAIEKYLQAIQADALNVAAIVGIARVYNDLGDSEEARWWLSQAERLDPARLDLIEAKAEWFIAQGLYGDMIEWAQAELRRWHPNNPLATEEPPAIQYWLGIANILAGHFDQASHHLELALKAYRGPQGWLLQTKNLNWITLLAFARQSQNKLDQANRLLDEAIEYIATVRNQGIERGDHQYVLATALSMKGLSAQAMDALELAASHNAIKLWQISNDPRLQSLRTEQRFKVLENTLSQQQRHQRLQIVNNPRQFLKLPAVVQARSDTAGDLDQYVAHYALPKEGSLGQIRIKRKGSQLLASVSGREAMMLVSLGGGQFTDNHQVYKLTFVRDSLGRVTHLLLYHDGFEAHAKRLPALEDRQRITLEADLLDKYQGLFANAYTHMYVQVTALRDRLGFQVTGEPRIPMLAQNRRSFFNPELGVELKFVLGPSGIPTKLVIQNPMGTFELDRVEHKG